MGTLAPSLPFFLVPYSSPPVDTMVKLYVSELILNILQRRYLVVISVAVIVTSFCGKLTDIFLPFVKIRVFHY
jgi:hypothetical protein